MPNSPHTWFGMRTPGRCLFYKRSFHGTSLEGDVYPRKYRYGLHGLFLEEGSDRVVLRCSNGFAGMPMRIGMFPWNEYRVCRSADS